MRATRKQLTDEVIAALAPKRKRQLVYDHVVRHLAVCITPKGKRTFVVVKRPNGKQHPTRRRIGVVGRMSLEQARERAIKFDPTPTDKFSDVAERYFERIAKQRRGAERERTMRRELMSQWGNKQLSAITKQDVIDRVNAAKDRGEYAAHHLLAYIKAFFSYATGNNLLDHSPADSLKPRVLIGAKEPRQRVLTDIEIKAVWHAAERCGQFGKLVQLILATGARRGEAAFITPQEINGAEWIVPAARFKSNHAHLVPLSPLARDLIAHAPFGVTGFSKSKKRLDKHARAELPTLTNYTLHDLRRTVRTRLTPITEYEVAEAVIGHSRTGLNKTYNLYEYVEEKRHALDAWASRLHQIVHDSKAKSA